MITSNLPQVFELTLFLVSLANREDFRGEDPMIERGFEKCAVSQIHAFYSRFERSIKTKETFA